MQPDRDADREDPITRPDPTEERGRKAIRDYAEKPATSWGLMPLLLGLSLLLLVGYLLFGGETNEGLEKSRASQSVDPASN